MSGLKTSDILRVCMCCKRIAQGGTNDWHEDTEDEAQSHPAPSHGYCDDCYDRLYGDDAETDKQKE